MSKILDLCRKYSAKTVFEIGVGNFNACRTKYIWGVDDFVCSMFEPNPISYAEIFNKSSGIKNTTLHNVAIMD